jgi:hypothetical protein
MHSLRLPSSAICATVLATLALGACSASPLMPFTGMAPAFAPASVSAAARSCRQSAASFFFGGSCDRVALEPSGATASLADYRGITAVVKLLPKRIANGERVTVFDATGKGDIKGYDGNAFPHFRAHGKPLVYLKFVVAATSADMRKSPYINIIDASEIRGSSCTPEFLEANRWTPTNYRVPIFRSHVVRFLPVRAQFNLPHGASYLVVVCG